MNSSSVSAPARWRPAGQALLTARDGVADAWRHHRGWLVAASAMYALLSVLPAVQVVMMRRLLAHLDGQLSTAAPTLLGLTVVVGGFFPVSQVAWQCGHRLGMRLTADYQAALAHAAARLAPRDLADPAIVAGLEAADAGTGALGPVPGLGLQLAATGVTAVALCSAIWQVSAWSAVLVVASLLPTVVAFTSIARLEMAGLPALADASRRGRYATELLIQQRSGTELATLQTGSRVADRAAQAHHDYCRTLDGLTSKGGHRELAAAAATCVLLGVALTVMVSRQESVATCAAAITGVISALHAVRSSANSFGMLISTTPKAGAYRTFLRDAPRVTSVPVVHHASALAMSDVSYRYDSAARDAVHGVTLQARRGEIVALVGVNGAGKTTAINCILGTLSPSHGSVELDGQPLDQLTDAERLARFGLLTQEFGRYEFSVRDTLSLADPTPHTDDDLWAALDAAEAGDLVRSLPHGLDTRLGQQWGGIGLSGGQWQRISLARIHLRAAAVWILDEPTSAIDAEAERDIFNHLAAHKADHITLLVSHRAWTLQAADRIHVFDGGQIVQTGTYQELITTPGRFHEIFTEQLTTPTSVHQQASAKAGS